MKQFKTLLLISLGFLIMSSSCSLFKKLQGPPVPPPPKKEEPTPPKEEPTSPISPVESAAAPFHVPAFGKEVRKPVYDIALFLPLSIDQVTSDTGFSVNNRKPLPGSTLSGLEFYEGALMAMDSLQHQGIRLRLSVFDTKSTSRPLKQVLQSKQMDSVDLIIGSVTGEELKEIGNFAKEDQINFISATYPNDAGITDNPFLIILNSTLRIHCDAIQSFAQQKFSDQQITVIYRNTPQEKQNLEYLKDSYEEMNFSRKAALQPFEWTDNTTADDVAAKLSKNKNNVIILASLYPEVALSIIGQLATLQKDYTLNLIGMPTLYGQANLAKPEYNGIDIYYSTPFPYINLASYPAIKNMMWKFFHLYRARPSDIALKGYETLFYFGNLLQKKGLYFNSAINDPSGRILTQFDFRPIYKNDQKESPPDYFENSRLYFMRERDGKVMPAN